MSDRDDEIEELKHDLLMAQNRHRTIQAILSDEIDRLRAFVAAYDKWVGGDTEPHSDWLQKSRSRLMREARAAIDAKAGEES